MCVISKKNSNFAAVMENQYIKQFPELMKGKTVMYVHGFGSSGQSGTVARLRQVLPNARVVAPDLPVHPEEAMQLLRTTCEKEQPSLIVGTSMGGMFAEMLYGYDRIVTNPAFNIADTMQSHGLTGKQQFFSPRQDGVQEFYVDKPMVKEYRQMTEQNFLHADDEDEQQRVFGLFGDEDPLVHTYDLFTQHYSQAIRFHGEHRMDDRSFMHSVLPVIRWIDDRQEKRSRPIVYIGVECLTPRPLQGERDLKPVPSVQKAVRLLIEHYQVYFVAPALSSVPSSYSEVTSWLEEYINVPAWGHTIFTNQRQLLYGDYLIARKKEDDTMATFLEFGSDTFKTWEDVIGYFERLGGQ
jgi:hypothetical protein